MFHNANKSKLLTFIEIFREEYLPVVSCPIPGQSLDLFYNMRVDPRVRDLKV